MVTIKIKGKDVALATTLRVVYSLRDISHAGSLQEAIGSISKLDLDGQLELLYAAYKAGDGRQPDAYGRNEFIDSILDTMGIFAISNAINQLTEGLLYSGLSPEEIESKKAMTEAAIVKASAAGATSSVEDTILV